MRRLCRFALVPVMYTKSRKPMRSARLVGAANLQEEADMPYVSESDMSFARICMSRVKKLGAGRTLAILAASYLAFVAFVKITDTQNLDWANILVIALFFWVLALLWVGFLAYDVLAIVSCWRMGTRGKVADVLSLVTPLAFFSCLMGFGSFLFKALYTELFPFATYVALEVFVFIMGFFPGGSGDGDESLSKEMRETVRKTASPRKKDD